MQRGSFKAMDPKQIHDQRIAAQKDLKEVSYKDADWVIMLRNNLPGPSHSPEQRAHAYHELHLT